MKRFLALILISTLPMSTTLHAQKKTSQRGVIVNRVMHTAFLMRKSQILSSLRKKIQKRTFHRGRFFKGEVPEIKGIAQDLKKFDFQIKDIPNGLLLSAKKDKQSVSTKIEFIDPLAGIIAIDGIKVRLSKKTGYLEGVQVVSHILLRPFLEKKEKKTGFDRNLFDLLIGDAYADGEYGEYRYKRPKGVPAPYERLWTRLIDRAKNVRVNRDLLIGVAIGAATGGAVGGVGVAVGATSGAVAGGATAGSIISNSFSNNDSLAAGLLGGTVGGAVGGVALVGGTAAAAAAGEVVVALLGLSALGIYAIDEIKLAMSKLDDLERVGEGLNTVLKSCEEGKRTFYKKTSDGQSVFNEEFAKELERATRRPLGGRGIAPKYREFLSFQLLWNASKESNPKSSGMACHELTTKEGLDKLKKEIGDDKKLKALNSLCRTYDGILQCYRSAPSPFGEQPSELTKKEAIRNGERSIKQKGDAHWDFYRSLPGVIR
ncbi:MAG: hypothetical protein OXB88_00415 [Bacteriovoracales bacterium]|nr:hypothetical protein [Bacteriovoracales bacterium]